MSIEIQLSDDKKKVTLKLPEDFNYTHNKEFSMIKEEISDKSVQCDVDFSNTNRVDSAALGMLLILRRHLGGDEAKVAFINCNEQIKELLAIAKFEKLFKIS